MFLVFTLNKQIRSQAPKLFFRLLIMNDLEISLGIG